MAARSGSASCFMARVSCFTRYSVVTNSNFSAYLVVRSCVRRTKVVASTLIALCPTAQNGFCISLMLPHMHTPTGHRRSALRYILLGIIISLIHRPQAVRTTTGFHSQGAITRPPARIPNLRVVQPKNRERKREPVARRPRVSTSDRLRDPSRGNRKAQADAHI